jgi:hypothetical protein
MRKRLRALDPGLIRLEQVIKGGLAMVTAMAVMLAVMLGIAPSPDIAAVIFGFIVAFVCFMLVNEVQPRERQRTMLLVAPLFIVAPFVVAVVQASPLAVAMLLLALMFVSFYVRRFGQRAAELGIATVMAFYFSWLFGATLESAPWFAVGAVVGVGSAFFWQFIVKPFNPLRYLRRGVADFGENAADSVAAIAGQIAAPSPAAVEETKATLKRVGVSRKVIGMQAAGLAGAPDWTRERVGQLNAHLFDVQQGLERMAASADDYARRRDQIPESVRASVDQSLAALQGALAGAGSPQTRDALQRANAQLADQVRNAGDGAEAWKPALMGLSIGGARVAQSAHGVRALAMQAPTSAPNASGETKPATATPAPVKPAQPSQAGLHPTTKLGIQAAVACGLAMIIATVLKLDRPYWAFWTAYIVVAGPAGESLQKIIYRVVGITLGSLFGTLLVLLLPNSLLILLPLQILALMLVLYTRVINYAWTCFWITTFVALMYRVEGVPPATILIERPINTLIGAVIAALVVWFVFPVRERAKFGKALAGFLTATDAYLSALVGSLKKAVAPAAVGAAAIQAASAYEAVTQTFPALAMEYSPLAGAQSPAVAESTIINALHTDVDRFAQFVTGDDVSADQTSLMGAIQGTIHANIQSVKAALGGQTAPPLRTLEGVSDQLRNVGLTEGNPDADADADADPRVGVRAVAYLGNINQSILALGNEMGLRAQTADADAEQAQSARQNA